MTRVVVLLSGGLDSTVLATWYARGGHEVHAVTVSYGQRHRREVRSAEVVAGLLGIPWTHVEVPTLARVMGGSSQTDPTVAVPHGAYDDATMRATVVPNRNMILLAIAAAHAISVQAEMVAYAAHAGDHAIYPDCRPEFARAMAGALAVCDYRPIVLATPFLRLSKADIVRAGVANGAPLSATWTCYEGGDRPCGKCGACDERRGAFLEAGVPDPWCPEVMR